MKQLDFRLLTESERERERIELLAIEVTFLNTEKDTWLDGPFFHMNYVSGTYWNDVELHIAPFGYLRNVREVNFSFPEGFTISPKIERTILDIQKETHFHFIYYQWPYYRADYFFIWETLGFLELDKALDTAPGPTAAILRRERLIHCRWYRRKIDRLLDVYKSKEWNEYVTPTNERYEDFELLDPGYHSHGWKLLVTQDANWLKTWRNFWPDGIPPREERILRMGQSCCSDEAVEVGSAKPCSINSWCRQTIDRRSLSSCPC